MILFGVVAQEDDDCRQAAQTVEVGGRVEFVGGKRALVVRPERVGDKTRKEGVESHVEGDGPSWTENARGCHAVFGRRWKVRSKQPVASTARDELDLGRAVWLEVQAGVATRRWTMLGVGREGEREGGGGGGR